jgi:hypothetical protein
MSMLNPHSEWVWAGFAVLWFGIWAILSRLSGWHEFAQRFESIDTIDGEKFRFASGAMGQGYFPVKYGNCLFVIVGDAGIELSTLWPFRFMHPRLLLRWADIETCRTVKFWFMPLVEVRVKGFRHRILFRGAAGQKILETWSHHEASPAGH